MNDIDPNQKVRVLFVCLGNICRSPMAEAVFRHKVREACLDDRIEIDSAGTGHWHVGDPPHHGTLAALRRNGIEGDDLRARQICRDDLDAFDYVLVMDSDNLSEVIRMNRQPRATVRLLMEYAPAARVHEVPDPFYSGRFDEVYALVDAACDGLLAAIRRDRGW